MKIERQFTKAGRDAYAGIEFTTTVSEIRNPDGTVVFRLEGIEVPDSWSQVASDVIAQKYFRKAGVPVRLKRVAEEGVPEFLWRSVADEDALEGLPKAERFTGETSSKQVFDRLAGAWAYWGWKGGYFTSEEDAQAYFDEMRHMLATQRAAPNSPQWFNTGLHWAYGIDGPSQGHFYVDYRTGVLTKSETAYEHPQPHACFIQSVSDDLVNDGGIMDLWVREARLFKYGSGTGTNFSSSGRGREALGRRQVLGPHGLPQDRRPRGGCDQVGRHHAPRGQDGDLRHGSPRHRGLHQLEGHRGAEGGLPRRRLEDARALPERHLRRHRPVGRHAGRRHRPREERHAQDRDPRRQARRDPRDLRQARARLRPAGVLVHRVPDLRHRLGFGGLRHRLGPELQQLGPRDRRLP
jgi:ribonucleotide reductase alpha subunit